MGAPHSSLIAGYTGRGVLTPSPGLFAIESDDGVNLDGNAANAFRDTFAAFSARGHGAPSRLDSSGAALQEILTRQAPTGSALRTRIDSDSRERIGRRQARRDSALRYDAATPLTGYHFARELEEIYAEIVETPRPATDAFTLFEARNINPGARNHTFRRITRIGGASFFVGGNAPIPVVGNARDEVTYDQHTVVTSFQWDMFEAMSSDFANSGLVREGLTTADLVLHEFADHIIWNGSSAHRFYGVLNTPKLPRIIEPTLFDGSASPDDVLEALFDAASHAKITSKGTQKPDTMVCGFKVLKYLSETRLGSVNDTTILAFFLQHNAAGIKSVQESWHLDDSGPSGRCGILFYVRNGQRGVQNTIGAGFTMLPVQQQVFMNRVYCYMRLGGVVMREPGNQLLMWVTCRA